MFRVVGLDENAARKIAAPGSSGDLRQDLKRAFGGSKIREAQSDVYRDHADQRYVVKIVALREHLCSHQHIGFAGVESQECGCHTSPLSHRVAVDACDPKLREPAPQDVFNLLGPLADEVEKFTLA